MLSLSWVCRMKNEFVVCYVVDNRAPRKLDYMTECIYSATSLRRFYSGPVILFTNEVERAEKRGLFDEILPLSVERQGKNRIAVGTEKILGIKHCLPNCLFIDSDTIILDNITLIQQREEFDLAGVTAPWRWNFNRIAKNPMTERQRNKHLNTGLIYFKGDKVQSFVDEWENIQVNYKRDGSEDIAKLHDQVNFAVALEDREDIDVLNLPINYNYRSLKRDPSVTGRIYVQHAHHHQTDLSPDAIETYIDSVEEELNGKK